MPFLRDESSKLKHDSHSLMCRNVYILHLCLDSVGAVGLHLKREVCDAVVYVWSMPLHPEGVDRSSVNTFIQDALCDLDHALRQHQVRIKRVEASHDGTGLLGASWYLTKGIVEARGERCLQQNVFDAKWVAGEMSLFSEIRIMCDASIWEG